MASDTTINDDGMSNQKWVLAILLVLCGGWFLSIAGHAATAVGFGVGMPATTVIDWSNSFPYATVEAFTDSDLAVRFTIGTYPTDFPTGFETSTSFIVKGWGGPVAVYAGAGLSVYWKWLTAESVWKWSPYMNMLAGMELRVATPLSLFCQVRALDPIPLTFTVHPQVSLGARLVFGPPRFPAGPADGVALWVIIGLGVLALVAYLPRN